MISRRSIALAPLAVLLANRAWAADGDLILPLDMTGPRPRMVVSVPGGETEPWVIDTGASGSVIDIERARRWGLPQLELIEVGSPAGGAPIQGFRTTIAGARIGDTALPDFHAAAIPQRVQHAEHAGVLSPNIFSGRLVAFEFSQSRVRITDRANAPRGESTPYSVNFPLPAITVSVAGQTFEAHMDTGAPQLVSFPYAAAASLPLAAAPEQVGVARFVDGEHPLYRAQIRGVLQIGPLVLGDPQVALTDGLPFVNVGTAALRQMTVTLDPERRVSWATLAG
jgi:hypothetical protein